MIESAFPMNWIKFPETETGFHEIISKNGLIQVYNANNQITFLK